MAKVPVIVVGAARSILGPALEREPEGPARDFAYKLGVVSKLMCTASWRYDANMLGAERLGRIQQSSMELSHGTTSNRLLALPSQTVLRELKEGPRRYCNKRATAVGWMPVEQ